MFQKEESKKVSETIVGSSVLLKGNLKSDGPVIVEGSVSGEIKTKDNVLIKPGALVSGSVKAKNINVAGEIRGNVSASEKLELTSSARVIGDINAIILSIAPGAFFAGKSLMETEKEIKKQEEAVAEEVKEPEETKK